MQPGPSGGKSGRGKLIAIICEIAGVVIATALILIFLVFKPSSGIECKTKEELAQKYVEFLNAREPERIADLMIPSGQRDEMEDKVKDKFGTFFMQNCGSMI